MRTRGENLRNSTSLGWNMPARTQTARVTYTIGNECKIWSQLGKVKRKKRKRNRSNVKICFKVVATRGKK